MLGRVAELHYKHGLTHQQVANLLGLSRVQVTRMLARARAEGIVEIRVHSDEPIFPIEQSELMRKYGLDYVGIAPTFKDPEETLNSIGTVGAAYLRKAIKPGMFIAVGLSSTLARIAPQMKAESFDVTFVPAIGSRPSGTGIVNPYQVAELLAEAVNGNALHLPAPLMASSAASAATFLSEPEIQETLHAARNAELGLFGIGGTKPGTGLLMDGLHSQGAITELLDKGVVGDISAGFFDAKGREVRGEITERMVGLSLQEILAIPQRAAFAGGRDKIESILGALAGGLVTTLITDQETAQAILTR
jgi:DNA-binding transcriptional regulator LsrR (DeoR family)